MHNSTANRCPHCGTTIARRRVVCDSRDCLGKDSAAWLQRRRAAREQRPKPTIRKPLTATQRAAVHARCDWTCHLCGYPIDAAIAYPDIEAAVVDHITPLALGGTNDDDNLASAHNLCNLIKNSRPLADVI